MISRQLLGGLSSYINHSSSNLVHHMNYTERSTKDVARSGDGSADESSFSPLQTPSHPLSFFDNPLAPSSLVHDDILQKFIQHPMLCYSKLAESQNQFRATLKTLVHELTLLKESSPHLLPNDHRIDSLSDSLSLFLRCCELYPHPHDALEPLRLNVDALRFALAAIRYESPSFNDALSQMRIASFHFNSSVSKFFNYSPTKYRINALESLSLTYESLFSVHLGSPHVIVFDVDGLLIDSEPAQRSAWNQATFEFLHSDFVLSLGSKTSRHAVAQQLSEMVTECFVKDNVGPLLHLFTDILEYNDVEVVTDGHRSRSAAVEAHTSYFSAKILSSLANGELGNHQRIPFTDGAVDLMNGCRKRGLMLGIATSSPKSIAEGMLRPTFNNEPRLLGEFDEIFHPDHRCYGDLTPLGLPLPERKPNPLAILTVIRAMELSSGTEIPFSKVVFTDDSCSNCSAAASLQSWRGDKHIEDYQTDLFNLARNSRHWSPKQRELLSRPLIHSTENLGGVIGITNNNNSKDALGPWERWLERHSPEESRELSGSAASSTLSESSRPTVRAAFSTLRRIASS